MAIYTIEIDERTTKGKALRTLLENEDIVSLKPLPTEYNFLLKEIATGLLQVKHLRNGNL